MATKRRSDEEKRKIVTEARRRFKRAEAWEATARKRFIDDVKFAEGDSDNLYQWPDGVRERVEGDGKAILTINKTRQHNLDILNDARQSRVAIKVRATGGGASAESAQIYMGVIRHIEYISNAESAYQHALSFAVRGGIGYWRILTDYANDDSFDQEIFIRRVKDPLSVYLDPDLNEADGSDAGWGFVFTSKDRAEWEDEDERRKGRPAPGAFGLDTWIGADKVRIAEYFRRVAVKDRLIAYPDPDQPEAMKVVRESETPAKLVKLLEKLDGAQIRPLTSHRVEWFKIVGDEITEEREWLGSYIPIIRCIGEETIIDNEMDRKGHTRALKDPQRMFNYNAVGSVEYGALQSKTPWVTPADAIEGYEEQWNTANTANHAVLPWNHRDDEGQEIPEPRRTPPPVGAPVFMEGMNSAAEWMRMVSGQYQADMGAPGNERSGAAINARQRQGDNATYHFLAHEALAIRLTGKQIIELVGKVYDTERVIDIVDPDGQTVKQKVRIDPQAKVASEKVDETRDEVAAIFNPKVGKYEVEADVGPAFATARQEAFNAYLQLLTQNHELTSIIGDIMIRCADFPFAEEAAARLKRMVPAQALEDGPSPDLMAAKQQIDALQGFVKQLATKLADQTAKHANDQEKNVIQAYDAQTKRLAALKDALATNPDKLVELVRQVIEEAEATSAHGMVQEQTQPAQDAPPALAAPQAPAMPPPGPDGPQMGPAAASPEDMGAGPAAEPGAAPVGV